MKPKLFSFTFILTFLFLSSFCQKPNSTVKGNNEFAFDLFKTVFSKEKNVFLSPYSISSAMAMTYAGARNKTKQQMAKVFHFDLTQMNTHKGFMLIPGP